MQIKYPAIVAALLIGIVPAYAQTGTAKSSTVLNAEINFNFPDQNVGTITPFILRQTTLDLVASSVLGQSSATAGQVPVYPGSGAAAVPTTVWVDNPAQTNVYFNKGAIPNVTVGAVGYQGGTLSVVSSIDQATGPGTAVNIIPTITTGNSSTLGVLQVQQTDSTKLTSNMYMNGIYVNLVSGNAFANQNAGTLSFMSSKAGADSFGGDFHGLIDSGATVAPNYVVGLQGTVELNSATYTPASFGVAVLGTVESSTSKKANSVFAATTSTSAGASFILTTTLGTSPMTDEGIVLKPANDSNLTYRAYSITNAAGTDLWKVTKSGINTAQGYNLAAPVSINTAPTIASGFCSTASNTSISASNGTAAFDILIGGATCGSTGTLTMPAATTGWVCSAHDVTTPATHNIQQSGTQGSTTAVVLTDYARVAGTAQNFNPADHIHVMCSGY